MRMMFEFINVLDEEGYETGLTKIRSDVLSDGDWHRAVHVYVVSPTKGILFKERAPSRPIYPNLYDFTFGRHLRREDTSRKVVSGCSREQLGVQIDEAGIRFLFTNKSRMSFMDEAVIENQFQDVYLVLQELDISSCRIDRAEIGTLEYMLPEIVSERLRKDPRVFFPRHEEFNRIVEYVTKEQLIHTPHTERVS